MLPRTAGATKQDLVSKAQKPRSDSKPKETMFTLWVSGKEREFDNRTRIPDESEGAIVYLMSLCLNVLS